jgi:hypothetical protein
MAVEDYSRKQDEMEALQFKLQEMDNQKKEFKGFLKCTIAIISVLYAYIGNAVLSLVHSTLNAE